MALRAPPGARSPAKEAAGHGLRGLRRETALSRHRGVYGKAVPVHGRAREPACACPRQRLCTHERAHRVAYCPCGCSDWLEDGVRPAKGALANLRLSCPPPPPAARPGLPGQVGALGEPTRVLRPPCHLGTDLPCPSRAPGVSKGEPCLAAARGLEFLLLCRMRALLLGGCVAPRKGSAGLFWARSQGGHTWESPEVAVGAGTGLQSGRARVGTCTGPIDGWLRPPGGGAATRHRGRSPSSEEKTSGLRAILRQAHFFQKGPRGASRGLARAGCWTHGSAFTVGGGGGGELGRPRGRRVWGWSPASGCGAGKGPALGTPLARERGGRAGMSPGPPGAGSGWRGLCGQQDLEGGMRWGLANGMQGADCSGLAGVF